MKISGLLKFSMIDFPGSISAIVFTQGCNVRCAYCHNPELIPPAQNEEYALSEEEVLEYLERRKHSLDGVVITGGEPTLQKDLDKFARFASFVFNVNICIKLNACVGVFLN